MINNAQKYNYKKCHHGGLPLCVKTLDIILAVNNKYRTLALCLAVIMDGDFLFIDETFSNICFGS